MSVNERDSVWQREGMCERGCMCVRERVGMSMTDCA